MEVLLYGEDQSLVLRNALDLVTPLARNLDCCLDCLRSSVHWEDHVKAKELGRVLSEAWEHIVVECPTAEGQSRCLLGQCLDELGVAVALVHGAVCGEEVEVVLALGVPDTASTCAREDYE